MTPSCRLRVFGVDAGRKEFEAALKSCSTHEHRSQVYLEWLSGIEAARDALAGKTSQRDEQKRFAYTSEEDRVLGRAQDEFPDSKYAASCICLACSCVACPSGQPAPTPAECASLVGRPSVCMASATHLLG